jgi:hypothetical protein
VLGEIENEPANRRIGERSVLRFLYRFSHCYAGWLDKDKWLSNRACFVIDKEGIVQFKKVMEKPREILSVLELEKALEGLYTLSGHR